MFHGNKASSVGQTSHTNSTEVIALSHKEAEMRSPRLAYRA